MSFSENQNNKIKPSKANEDRKSIEILIKGPLNSM